MQPLQLWSVDSTTQDIPSRTGLLQPSLLSTELILPVLKVLLHRSCVKAWSLHLSTLFPAVVLKHHHIRLQRRKSENSEVFEIKYFK